MRSTNLDVAAAPSLALAARTAEFERRVDAVRGLLSRRGVGAAVLVARRNFAWLTVGGVNHVVLAADDGAAPILVTQEGVTVLAPINEAARIREEEIADLDVEIVELAWFDANAADREAARRASGSLANDADLEDELAAHRSVLPDVDADRLRWLGHAVDAAVGEAIRSIRRGDREDDIAARLQFLLASVGIRVPVVLAAADDRIVRYRHPLPGPTQVERRLMLVAVAERWGLHAAVTRFAELEEPDRQVARRFAAVRSVQEAMHAATAPGATLGDVLDAARAAYAETGFAEEWRLHHQGGSIGYRGRERIAVPGDATPVRPGMAFAWNPSITGVKVEDTILLGADGSREIITR
ncbi:MAG: M24 family metallopeptidase [Chloroflexota bacterium]|nr:M24 family metallopeptidase [Chloroflexota bacterium]